MHSANGTSLRTPKIFFKKQHKCANKNGYLAPPLTCCHSSPESAPKDFISSGNCAEIAAPAAFLASALFLGATSASPCTKPTPPGMPWARMNVRTFLPHSSRWLESEAPGGGTAGTAKAMMSATCLGEGERGGWIKFHYWGIASRFSTKHFELRYSIISKRANMSRNYDKDSQVLLKHTARTCCHTLTIPSHID